MAEASLPTTPRQRRKWLRVLPITLGTILLLILLAPTILSTGLGNHWLLSLVNGRIAGQIQVQSLSLGWGTGFKVRGLKLLDPQGRQVADIDGINTQLTLLDAITSRLNVGDVHIFKMNANLVTGRDGMSNLQQALALRSAATASVAGAAPSAGTAKEFPEFHGDIVCDNATITSQKPDMPPSTFKGDNLHFKFAGKIDAVKNEFLCTDDALLEERDPQTHDGNTIQIAKNSRFSWADGACDLTVTLDYDLARLNHLLVAYMPQTLQMEGRRKIKLHLYGKPAEGSGWAMLRGYTLDKTSIGYDRLQWAGLDLGKIDVPLSLQKGVMQIDIANLPANGGTLTLPGHLDLNLPQPAYILDKSTNVAQNIALNQKLAAGPLAFLPFMWGAMKSQDNTIAVSGQINIKVDQANIPLNFEQLKKSGMLKGVLNVNNLQTNAPIFSQITDLLKPFSMFKKLNLNLDGSTMHDVTFVLKDGKIRYDHLEIALASAGMIFSGSVGLDKSLDMNVQITAAGLNLPIPLGMKGTITKPELALTNKSILKGLEGIPKAGSNLLDNIFGNKKK